jgi:hypothetical protein
MPATLYLGVPKSGKTTVMQAHVQALAAGRNPPIFLVVDHDDSWGKLQAPIYHDPAEWWRHPVPVAIFRAVPGPEIARLAIAIGWSTYVDDEIDLSLAGWNTNPIREIVKRGRHLRNRAGKITAVSAMLATHRPSNLPSDVIGTFDRVYIGRLQSFTDAERVFREGWIKGTLSAIETRTALERRMPGEFSVWP